MKEDSSLKLPVGAERRRVFAVDQVSVDKTGSITSGAEVVFIQVCQ